MSAFTQEHARMLEEYSQGFYARYPQAARLAVTKFPEGVVIVVCDQAGRPVFANAIRRDDWLHLLDIIPVETIEFPLVTWDEFDAREVETAKEDSTTGEP